MDAVAANAQGLSQGLSLLIRINWDRLVYLAGVAAALGAGAWLGTLALS